MKVQQYKEFKNYRTVEGNSVGWCKAESLSSAADIATKFAGMKRGWSVTRDERDPRYIVLRFYNSKDRHMKTITIQEFANMVPWSVVVSDPTGGHASSRMLPDDRKSAQFEIEARFLNTRGHIGVWNRHGSTWTMTILNSNRRHVRSVSIRKSR